MITICNRETTLRGIIIIMISTKKTSATIETILSNLKGFDTLTVINRERGSIIKATIANIDGGKSGTLYEIME